MTFHQRHKNDPQISAINEPISVLFHLISQLFVGKNCCLGFLLSSLGFPFPMKICCLLSAVWGLYFWCR